MPVTLLGLKWLAVQRLTGTTARVAATGTPAWNGTGLTATGATHGPHQGRKNGRGGPHHPAHTTGRHGHGFHHVYQKLKPKPQVTGGQYQTEPIHGL